MDKYHDTLEHYYAMQSMLNMDIPLKEELTLLFNEFLIVIDNSHWAPFDVSLYDNTPEYFKPYLSLMTAYQTTRACVNLGIEVDMNSLELLAILYAEDEYPFVNIYLHIHMALIYSLQKNYEAKKRHFLAAVKMSFEHEIYYPLVMYFNYFVSVANEVADQLPENFKDVIIPLNQLYVQSYERFIRVHKAFANIPKLTYDDYEYLGYLIRGVSNKEIAANKGVTTQSVSRHYQALADKFGVTTKRELSNEYLNIFING